MVATAAATGLPAGATAGFGTATGFDVWTTGVGGVTLDAAGAGVLTATAAVPPGMMAYKVPGGRYAVFTSEVGPVEKVVVATWQRVWAATDIERAYKVDFEVYDVRARDLKNALVDLFIGIK